MRWSIFFFFFQAEDGIRDRNVTGVQTCALPISLFIEHAGNRFLGTVGVGILLALAGPRYVAECDTVLIFQALQIVGLDRSEERRVGKEWGGGWAPCHCKEKVETVVEAVQEIRRL